MTYFNGKSQSFENQRKAMFVRSCTNSKLYAFQMGVDFISKLTFRLFTAYILLKQERQQIMIITAQFHHVSHCRMLAGYPSKM